MAITNIYPNTSGKIVVTIKNNGNVEVTIPYGDAVVACEGTYSDSAGIHAIVASSYYNWEGELVLSPGESYDCVTSWSRNPSIIEMWMTCEYRYDPLSLDQDLTNDFMGPVQVK
jgi:hypothetical protein